MWAPSRLMSLVVVPLLLGGVLTRDAVAHEKGVLKPAARSFSPGDSLPVSGAQFGDSKRLVLFLVGVGGRYEVARVQSDTAGAFRSTLAVPDTIPLGSYRLIAVASDGDEVSSLDVAVLARPAGADASTPPMGADHDMAGPPSKEPLALDRARSPWVTGGAALLGLVALVGGLALLRRPAQGLE